MPFGTVRTSSACSLKMRLQYLLPFILASCQHIQAKAIPKGAHALKVMIVGDSMTQGHEGDYTWRYRIWEWFESQDVAVDFVGPFAGTRSQDAPSLPAAPVLAHRIHSLEELLNPETQGGYAIDVSLDFDKDHWSVWGRAVIEDVDLVGSYVKTYDPDYLLVMLGFNDMGWGFSDAEGTFQSMTNFVTNARAAKPK